MATTPPDVLQLARQGDPSAIAALINRHLEPKGISAQVTQQGSALQVVLESAQVPSQADLVAYVRKGITGLELSKIHLLSIHGKQSDRGGLAWTEEVVLNDAMPAADSTPTPDKVDLEIDGLDDLDLGTAATDDLSLDIDGGDDFDLNLSDVADPGLDDSGDLDFDLDLGEAAQDLALDWSEASRPDPLSFDLAGGETDTTNTLDFDLEANANDLDFDLNDLDLDTDLNLGALETEAATTGLDLDFDSDDGVDLGGSPPDDGFDLALDSTADMGDLDFDLEATTNSTSFDLDLGDAPTTAAGGFDLNLGDSASADAEDFTLDLGDSGATDISQFDLDLGDSASADVEDFTLDFDTNISTDTTDELEIDFGDQATTDGDEFDLDLDFSDSVAPEAPLSEPPAPEAIDNLDDDLGVATDALVSDDAPTSGDNLDFNMGTELETAVPDVLDSDLSAFADNDLESPEEFWSESFESDEADTAEIDLEAAIAGGSGLNDIGFEPLDAPGETIAGDSARDPSPEAIAEPWAVDLEADSSDFSEGSEAADTVAVADQDFNVDESLAPDDASFDSDWVFNAQADSPESDESVPDESVLDFDPNLVIDRAPPSDSGGSDIFEAASEYQDEIDSASFDGIDTLELEGESMATWGATGAGSLGAIAPDPLESPDLDDTDDFSDQAVDSEPLPPAFDHALEDDATVGPFDPEAFDSVAFDSMAFDGGDLNTSRFAEGSFDDHGFDPPMEDSFTADSFIDSGFEDSTLDSVGIMDSQETNGFMQDDELNKVGAEPDATDAFLDEFGPDPTTHVSLPPDQDPGAPAKSSGSGFKLLLGIGLGALILALLGILVNNWQGFMGEPEPIADPDLELPVATDPETEPEVDPEPGPDPAPEPEPEPVVDEADAFREAVNAAQNASNLAQEANTPADWQAVANSWARAIELMEQVPETDPNYEVAQDRAVAYQPNLAYAQQNAQQ